MKNYNKSLRYRKHQELGMKYFELEGLSFGFALGAISAVIILIFKLQYNHMLKASDFVFLISIGLYQLILKPKIYRGEINAYYRRNYKILIRFMEIYAFWGTMAVWRFLIMATYQGIKTHDLSIVLGNIYHSKATPITILASLLIFYLTYYQDKYTTIKEYSNKVNYKIKELKMHESDAIRKFYEEKDKEYKIKEFRGMYYDYKEGENTGKNEELNIEEEKRKKEEENMIRRKPRKAELK